MPRWLIVLAVIAVAATIMGFLAFVPGAWGG